MELTPGTVLEGTVRSIASFGAFINLPEGKTGLVHISEVSRSYVTDIHQHLSEGQAVKVKVLNTDERGRLSLSIKQAEEAPPARHGPQSGDQAGAQPRRPARSFQTPKPFQPVKTPEPETFEDKLKQFMADSNSKISGVRQYEHRTRSRKR